MKIEIRNKCQDFNGYRAARTKSLFNAETGAEFNVDFELDIEDNDWQIGLVVGPSGSGKTSVGRKLWADENGKGDKIYAPEGWPSDQPIIEAIGPDAEFNEVHGALASVGLGTVPSWLRPYRALSAGEQFRADLARILVERPKQIIIDEFTSVIDRQVAQIGAGAFGKAWRRGPGQVVLLACHYDVEEWLNPDWILDTATGAFRRRRLRRRPPITVKIHQTNWRYWPLFEPHHYLKLPHMIAAKCYVATVDGQLVAHLAVSTRPGVKEARACRLVVMPEWQGAGVGMRFLNAVCDRWRRGKNRFNKPMPTLFHTSHPGLADALRRDPKWTQVSGVLHGGKGRVIKGAKGRHGGHFRAVQGFRYLGETY